MILETKRLILDAIKESDRADYFRNISHDRKVLETFVCNYAEKEEDVDLSSYAQNEKMFSIRLKETGKLIGIILYFDDREERCEVGYGIGSDYWNQGYVTEAMKRFLQYLFENKGFVKVYASYFPGNEASRRVMEKCGMRYDHTNEKEMTYLGKERDLVYYAMENKEKKNKLIAYCGLDCLSCQAREATIKNDDDLRKEVAALWSELNHTEITPEMINCVGCRLDGAKSLYCDALCPIRKCAMEKGFETCADCGEMEVCEIVNAIHKNTPEAKQRLKGLNRKES